MTRVGPLRTLTVSSKDAAAYDESLVVSAVASDDFGNGVPQATVDFELLDGTTIRQTARAVTNSSGQAQATLRFTVDGATATVRATSGAVQTTNPKTVRVSSGPPAALVLVAGDAQTTAAGTAVSVPPAVRVSDAQGRPVLGSLVLFAVTQGGGTSGDSARTNATGLATVGGWILGPTAGANTLQATVTGVVGAVTFSANGVAGPAAKLAANPPLTQSAVASTAVASPPSVRVTDQYGNLVTAATPVTFTAKSGSTLPASPATVNTVGGIATLTRWTLGPLQGVNTLVARSAGLPPDSVVFTARGTQLPDTVRFVAGAGQSAPAGTPVAVPPRVKVVDALGNPVEGVWVRFTATGPGTGAMVAPDSLETNAQGEATVTGWSLGRTAGTNTLAAAVRKDATTTRTATLTATGVPGTAVKLAANSSTSQAAAASAAVGSPPSVKVTDAYDNLVTTATPVTFTVRSGGGSTVPASPATVNTTNGVATLTRWTLGPAQGPNTLVARGTGLTPDSVLFTATATQLPDTVRFVAGAGQSAPAGTPVAVPPKVKVVDAAGNPVAGWWVRFTATGPGTGATVAPDSLQTNAQGEATVTGWSLGRTVGTNTLTATVQKSLGSTRTATLTATGVPGAAAKLVRNSTDPQTAAASSAVGSPPSVKVTDAYDNLVTAATPVVFTVTAGGGALSPVSPATVNTTGGIASLTSWTLGPAQGVNTVVASSGTLQGSPMTFTATATQLPDTVRFVAGAGQSAPAGTPVAVLPKVKVVDAAGNPVAGWWVRFTATGPGTGVVVTPDSAQTNAQGEATVTGWSLGRTVGVNTLTATVQKVVGTLRTATLTATGVPGAAAKLVRNSTDPQSAAVSTAVASPPSVRVTDAYDNAVGAGTNVVFTVTMGGGTLNPASPATVSTNASGIATLTSWTLGAAQGTNTVEASSGALLNSPMTFTATAQAQLPTTISPVPGTTPQTATVGTAVGTDPAVVVKDASNAVIAGVSVTFRITGGGGTVNGGATYVTTTNGAGIATVPDWTLGTTAGANNNTLTAEATACRASPRPSRPPRSRGRPRPSRVPRRRWTAGRRLPRSRRRR
ncbi:MAG: hypothetical protein IPK33_02950 [Gemmatimonadetes bacterium]|nr:hypothetical protein [Gemmatimonadota bacterium]